MCRWNAYQYFFLFPFPKIQHRLSFHFSNFSTHMLKETTKHTISFQKLLLLIENGSLEHAQHLLKHISFKKHTQVVKILNLVVQLKQYKLMALVLDTHNEILSQSVDEEVFRILADCSRKLHRDIDAYAYTYQCAKHFPNKLQNWIPLIKSVYQTGDYWWAISISKEALQFHPKSNLIWSILLYSLLYIHSPLLEEHVDIFNKNFDGLHEKLLIIPFLLITNPKEAQLVLTQISTQNPNHIDVLLFRAKIALWKSDLKTVQTISNTIAKPDFFIDEDDIISDLLYPPTRNRDWVVLHIGLDVLQSQFDSAQNRITESLELYPTDGEIWAWQSEVFMRQQKYELGLEAITKAISNQQHFSLTSQILRFICLHEISIRKGHSPWKAHEIEIFPLLKNFDIQSDTPCSTLPNLLPIFGGNRGLFLTYHENKHLKTYSFAPPARQIGRMIQHILHTRGIDATIQQAHLEFQKYKDPLFIIYLGELYLWIGMYDKAISYFQQAISMDRTTKWAWIGLGACYMFQGDLEKAQQTWKDGLEIVGFAGPTLYAYRGECHRLMGNTQNAKSDLEYAIAEKPRRISAHINLALLEYERNPQYTETCIQKLWTDAPILMQEMTELSDSDSAIVILQNILVHMRGNRSSTFFTYFIKDKLRFM